MDGIAHTLFGMTKSRDVFPKIAGPPNGPEALRVSAIRQGVMGINSRAGVVPVSNTVCSKVAPEEPLTNSFKVNVAVRGPAMVGVNTMDTVQAALLASVVPQVAPLMAKSAGPDNEIPAIEIATGPGFERVTVWTALAAPTS